MHMRTTLALLLLLPLTGRTQVINGSFEQNGVGTLAGWDMACTCSAPALSTNVPGVTGNWSLRMNCSTNNCHCEISGFNRQPVPWLTPGDWVFSAWIRGVGPDGFDGTRVHLVEGLAPFNPNVLGTVSTLDSTWVYREQTITIPTGVDPDSLFVVFLADGLPSNQVRPVYYDDVRIEPVISTGTWAMNADSPRHWPDPASDALRIELPGSPSSLMLVDAHGRRMPLPTWSFRDRTVDLDVSALPAGPYAVIMSTVNGPCSVRFIKL